MRIQTRSSRKPVPLKPQPSSLVSRLDDRLTIKQGRNSILTDLIALVFLPSSHILSIASFPKWQEKVQLMLRPAYGY